MGSFSREVGDTLEVIQIGALAILQKWFLLGVAFILSLVGMKLFLFYLKIAESKNIFDSMMNSVFYGFIIWKLSLIIFEPSLVIRSPLSILYFSGGNKGVIVAIIFSFLYFMLVTRKTQLSFFNRYYFFLSFSLSTIFLYHGLSMVFHTAIGLYHFLIFSFTFLFLVWVLLRRNAFLGKDLITLQIMYSFLHVVTGFLLQPMQDKIFIFSLNQWFFLGIIILSLIYWDKAQLLENKQSKE